MDSSGARASIRLKVLTGELTGRVLEFHQPECVLLGRADDSLIRLPDDPFVSRQHLLIEICPPSVFISDLGSRNGFFVNDKQFPPSHCTSVSDGDLIVVGTNRFHLDVTQAGKGSGTPGMKTGNDTGILPADGMIGRYRIVQEFGQSWMGGTYQALDTSSGEKVSLKIMVPGAVFSEDFAGAFQKALGRLQIIDHPCTGRLKDFGRQGNNFYCVRDFVDGMDLSKLLKLRGGKLEMDEAIPIMLDVLDGLSHGYSKGKFVHRNLKPRNILTWGQGSKIRASVGDFGLFHALEIAGMNQTIHSRQYFDTPCYWPRERITFFNRADAASEVFSAAAVFYQILTGCMVRDGLFELQSRATWKEFPPGLADYLSLMTTNLPVPVRQRGAIIPDRLADVIDRALSEPIIRRGTDDPSATLSRERFPDPGSFRKEILKTLPKSLLSQTSGRIGG